MIQTKEKILGIAEKVFNDIEFDYDSEVGFKKISFKEEELIRGPNKGTVVLVWTVVLEYGKWLFGENRLAFLTIEDKTGNPMYLHDSHGVTEIESDTDGKYYTK